MLRKTREKLYLGHWKQLEESEQMLFEKWLAGYVSRDFYEYELRLLEEKFTNLNLQYQVL